MKVEGWLFLGCGIFFGGVDVVYWYTSYDPTGTTALALAVGLALLTGFYVLFTGRRLPPRHNFYRIPRIRSERPAFEAHYPHIVAGAASRGLEQDIPAISAEKKW